MENCHRNSGLSHRKWWFSIAMLNNQTVEFNFICTWKHCKDIKNHWLVVTGTWLVFFHIVGNFIIPIDWYFSEGWLNHQPDQVEEVLAQLNTLDVFQRHRCSWDQVLLLTRHLIASDLATDKRRNGRYSQILRTPYASHRKLPGENWRFQRKYMFQLNYVLWDLCMIGVKNHVKPTWCTARIGLTGTTSPDKAGGIRESDGNFVSWQLVSQ